jgi:hypothetical protein
MPVDERPNPEAWDEKSSAEQSAAADPPPDTANAEATGGEQGAPTSFGGLTSDGSNGSLPFSAPGVPATADTTGTAGDEDEGSAFLADLARAMQTAAGAERARSLEETDRRREASITDIRSKASVDATELERQAEAEVTDIGAWAEAEMERIREERERRIQARRDRLARRLDDHRQITERQVEAVEEAVSSYRGQLDGFFRRLEGEQDPGAIARLARTRPQFPPLDVVAVRARTAATADALGDDATVGTDNPVVGVMDPSAEGSPGDQPWAATSTAPADDAKPEESAEVPRDEPAHAVAASSRPSGGLLGSVPTIRPIGSWLNREREEPGSDSD